ncbi:MAG TPA: hypothetical protein PKZ84_03895 [Anaerolineae bacterium]|nr:hypothetical protein [Anaerolineae bacterium]HQI83483.1 hypothetical protein [Anaerolineae bacterium]
MGETTLCGDLGVLWIEAWQFRRYSPATANSRMPDVSTTWLPLYSNFYRSAGHSEVAHHRRRLLTALGVRYVLPVEIFVS